MYSKEELKTIRTEFWTEFKKHMQQFRSSNGRRMNWLNYPSEVDNVYVRLHADNHGIAFTFDIQGKDEGVRSILWEQMTELKTVLESEMGTDGEWLEDQSSDSVPHFSSIRWSKQGLRFSNPKHKEEIFAFFQDRLMAFDQFYQEFKDILINLAG